MGGKIRGISKKRRDSGVCRADFKRDEGGK